MPNCEIYFPNFSEARHTNLKTFSQHGLRKCRKRLLKKIGVRTFGQNVCLGCLSTFKLFGNSWDSSYIPCLQVVIVHRLLVVKRKFGKTSKSLKNVMKMIRHKTKFKDKNTTEHIFRARGRKPWEGWS